MALGGLFWAFPSCLSRVQYGFLEIGYPDEISTYTIATGSLNTSKFNFLWYQLKILFLKSYNSLNIHNYNDNTFEGYWFCSYNLGNFIGPIVSGIIVTQWDFRVATALGFGLYCFMVLLNFSTAPTSKKNMVDVDNSIRNGEDSGVSLCNDGNHESKEILH